ncbi:inositol monophosphatase [Mycobacterium sp. DL440]|uniref:inositol monophosphatase family protein n=1 Tax=Mycobacterium sp. DL440 TaxID=2675523 RepID=UPI00141FDBC9|nr:inositol monophosphatase [Mycobacterium sp. DL440]
MSEVGDLDPSKLSALVAAAAEILDAASVPFIAGHRAESAVAKQGNDFATEVDLAIERQVVRALTEATGIGVHGEEFGGEPIDSPLVWVLDPIDGTFNYAAGSPMAAILLGLLADGEPVAGLTWLPFTGQRYSALSGGPVRDNGTVLPPLGSPTLTDSIVGIQTFNIDSRGRFPGRYRVEVLSNLSRVCSRVRMHGATGVDLAYVAAGILGGAISFGHHIWDHAAGVALVRAAGGIVTDLAGDPWTAESKSALAAAPGVHERMLELVKSAGNPEDYL